MELFSINGLILKEEKCYADEMLYKNNLINTYNSKKYELL